MPTQVSTPPLQLALGPRTVPPPVGPAQLRPNAVLRLLGKQNAGASVLVDLPRPRATLELWVLLEQQPCNLLVIPGVLVVQVVSGQISIQTVGAGTALSPAAAIADGQWHHVALSYSFDPAAATTPTEFALFLDGNLLHSGNLGLFQPPAGSFVATFGSSQGSLAATTPTLRGLLSQIRIWARASSLDQIRASMRQVHDGDDPLLVHCYPLHEGRGARAWDLAPARTVAVVPASAKAGVTALIDGSLPFADRGALGLSGDQSLLSVSGVTGWAPWSGEPDAGYTVELTLRASTVAGVRTLLRLCAPTAVAEVTSALRLNIEDGRLVLEIAGTRLLTTSTVPLDRWCHVALIGRPDGSLSLRLDDASALELGPGGAMPIARTGTLILGSERTDTSRAAFAGRLSELRLWKLARDVADIRLLRGERLSGREEALSCYYPLTTLSTTLQGGQIEVVSTPDRCRRAGRVPTQDATAAAWELQSTPPVDQRFVLRFPSSAGQLTIPSRGAEQTRSYSVELWLRLQQLPPDEKPLILVRSATGAGCWLAVAQGGRLQQGVFIETTGGALPLELPPTEPGTVALNEWAHIALTHDGQIARLLVNGVPVQEVATDPPAAHGMALIAGGFIGQLCELRAFYRARTPDEIGADFLAPLLGSEPGLYGYWPLRGSAIGQLRSRDLGPRGIDAAIVAPGEAQLTRALGGGDRCLWLDGQQAYARIPGVIMRRRGFPDYGVTEWTIEVWACALPARDGSPGASVLLEGWGGAASFHFTLQALDGRDLLVQRGDYSQRAELRQAGVFADGGMHHIALSVATSTDRIETLRLYVDGILRGTTNLRACDLGRGSYDLFLGARGGRSLFLRGGLSELRIFGRALKDDEIWQRCFRRLSGDERDLIACFPMTGPPLTLGQDRLAQTALAPVDAPASALAADLQGVPLLQLLARESDARDRARSERSRHAAHVAALELQAVRARRAVADGEAKRRATQKIVMTSLAQEEQQLTAAQGSKDLTAVDSLLSEVVKVTTGHIESARQRIEQLSGRYRLGSVSLSLKYVAGAAGRGAYFPRRDTVIDPDRVSTLNLDFAPPDLPTAQPPPVKVPELVGYTALAARHVLSGSSLRLEIYDQVLPPSQASQVGRILRQHPPPGSDAPDDRTIMVFVGKASGAE